MLRFCLLISCTVLLVPSGWRFSSFSCVHFALTSNDFTCSAFYNHLPDLHLSADDGKYAITGGNDRTVRLWNPTRIDPGYVGGVEKHGDGPPPPALPIQTYSEGHSHPVAAVAVDPQSTTLVSTSDRTVVVSDIVSKRVKRRFYSHSGRVNAVACSNNAEIIVSAGYDSKVCLFDGRSWNATPVQTLEEAKDSVTAVSVWQQQGGSAAGAGATAEIITASVDGVVRYYDLRMGQIRCDDVGDAITGFALTNDGHCAAVSCLDGTIRLVERKSGELLHQYSGAHTSGKYGLQVSFTADDCNVVSGSEDGSVVLYDVVKGNVTQTLKRHTRPVCAIAAHPKREQTSVVISAGYDGSAIVWANPLNSSKWDRS